MSESICRWCKRRPGTEHDHNTLPEGDDGGLCWREWDNFWSDCYEHEQNIKESSLDLLEALQEILEWEPRQKDEAEREAYAKANNAIKKATRKQP